MMAAALYITVKNHFIQSLDLELEKAMMLQNLGTKHKLHFSAIYKTGL